MSIGHREQPEKDLDREFRPKSFARQSAKWEKQKQNRRARHRAQRDPECPPEAKYKGWEW